MTRMTKALPLTALLALLLATPGQAQERQKITYWAWTEHVAAAKALLPAFQKQNPGIDVEIVNLNPFDLQDKFLIALASGVGAPDVALILQRRFASYLDTEALLDTTSFVQPRRSFYPSYVYNDLLKNGRTFGLPYDQNPSVVFYRKDVFEAAGVAVPTTWEEFVQAGKKLSKPQQGIYMTWVSSPSGVSGVANFVQYLQSRGAQVFDKGGKVINNNALARSTLRFYYDLAKTHNIALGAANNSPEFFRALKEGRLLTYPAPAWAMFRMQAEAPDFAGKWGVMPWPRWSKTAPATTGAWGGNILAIPKQTKHAAAALKWASFLSATVQGQEQIWEVGKLFPAYRPATTSKKVTDGERYLGGQSIYTAAIQPRKVNTFNYFDWAQAETIIGRELDLMFAGQKTPEAAWNDIEADLRRQLRR